MSLRWIDALPYSTCISYPPTPIEHVDRRGDHHRLPAGAGVAHLAHVLQGQVTAGVVTGVECVKQIIRSEIKVWNELSHGRKSYLLSTSLHR